MESNKEMNNKHTELLIRIDERTAEVLKRLNSQDEEIEKISSRVTLLENFRWYILGAFGLLSGAVAIIGIFIKINPKS